MSPHHRFSVAIQRLPGRDQGFTLIELMITVAIVGILAAIALPSYRDYVIRGKLVDGTNALASLRARMEQYYQDNRTYLSVSSAIVSPCASNSTAGTFTVSCPTATLTKTTYILSASGSAATTGFTFTMDQQGTQATTALPTAWGTAPLACWITRKGDTC